MARAPRPRQVVVITGASRGIGAATAEAFARRGARLVLAARGRAALERVAARCRALGAAAIAVPTDLTDAGAVKTLARRAEAFGPGIDVWVSNVGVGAVGRFEETPIEAHEQVIRANLIGHINDAHAAVPVFLRQGAGIFINMISLGGRGEVLDSNGRRLGGRDVLDRLPAQSSPTRGCASTTSSARTPPTASSAAGSTRPRAARRERRTTRRSSASWGERRPEGRPASYRFAASGS
jgi:NAD(P)-dependent dehydrogenase (short-subunit alcohol dehydrogenase family)